MTKNTKKSGTKFFFITLIGSVLFYGALRLAGKVFDLDTNIDTGNPVVTWLYLIDYALIALSAIGLVLAFIISLFKK